MSVHAGASAIERVYDCVPKMKCKGLCKDSCGPIAMTRGEAQRIEEAIDGPIGKIDCHLTCPLLTEDGKCSVYAIRPLICRLWGIAKEMPCPFGCEPERRIEREEGAALMRAAELASGPFNTFTF